MTQGSLQSGLRTLALQAATAALLNHALSALLHERALPLLLDVLLFLAEGQCIRDPQQQDAGREHPQALAGVRDAGAGGGHDRAGYRRDLGARVRRHNVPQRAEPLVQRLVRRQGVEVRC